MPATNYIDPFTFNYSGIQNLNWIEPMGEFQPVTDMFGNTHFANPMDVDLMSGLPASAFSHTMADAMHEQNQAKLDQSNALEQKMNSAVDNYHKAMDSGDFEKALEWEHLANSCQQELYNLWNTPNYSGNPVVAPGIEE